MSSSRSFYGRQPTSGIGFRRSSNEFGSSGSLESSSPGQSSTPENFSDRGSGSSSFGKKSFQDRPPRPTSFISGARGSPTTLIIEQPTDISNISKRTEHDGTLTYLSSSWSFWTNSTKEDFEKTMVCCLVFDTAEEFNTLTNCLDESCINGNGRGFYFSKEQNRPSLQGRVFAKGNRLTVRVSFTVAREAFITLVAAIIGNSISVDEEGNPVLEEDDEILCCSATGKYQDVAIDIWKKRAFQTQRLVDTISKLLNIPLTMGQDYFFRDNSR